MLSNFQNRKNTSPKREEKQFIVFSLGEEKFGVDVKQIKQIIPMDESTHIPNAPSFVKGVINLRGDIIPIVELKEKLTLEIDSAVSKEGKIIIVELDNNSVGMQVDSVSEMMRIYEDEIADPPGIVKGINRNYLKGVGKLNDKLLILLDLDKIFSEEEMKELDNFEV
ncbi:MAG: chemotaxis protein CheW [Halanaerobiales bacterium]